MTPAEKKLCIELIINGCEEYCRKCIYCDTEKCCLINIDIDNDIIPEQDQELCLDGIVKFYERAEKDEGRQE